MNVMYLRSFDMFLTSDSSLDRVTDVSHLDLSLSVHMLSFLHED